MTAIRSARPGAWAAIVAGCIGLAACAQPQVASRPEAATGVTQRALANASAPPAAEASAAPTGPLAPLAWLSGCWQGLVNKREFREAWLPLRGGMLIGAGQQVLGGAMQDYEFLRIDARPDGIYFTQFSGDRKEISFRLSATTTDGNDTIFTFANTTAAFPARLVYRRGTEGWLYETIEGRLDGSDKKVIYPLRRVDCETGELVQ